MTFVAFRCSYLVSQFLRTKLNSKILQGIFGWECEQTSDVWDILIVIFAHLHGFL